MYYPTITLQCNPTLEYSYPTLVQSYPALTRMVTLPSLPSITLDIKLPYLWGYSYPTFIYSYPALNTVVTLPSSRVTLP